MAGAHLTFSSTVRRLDGESSEASSCLGRSVAIRQTRRDYWPDRRLSYPRHPPDSNARFEHWAPGVVAQFERFSGQNGFADRRSRYNRGMSESTAEGYVVKLVYGTK